MLEVDLPLMRSLSPDPADLLGPPQTILEDKGPCLTELDLPMMRSLSPDPEVAASVNRKLIDQVVPGSLAGFESQVQNKVIIDNVFYASDPQNNDQQCGPRVTLRQNVTGQTEKEEL
ncbi:unnamed protein product [Plutella xylostella]|uniref:(diamondback moth) hypothetical protein n=1 Tax=Plutella xylostella TaxID=51655 RepID=A0A8S4EWG8_PLUXY|nr:unnamed protein product [Plutella xylostella]